ncbi:hypothetical protein [Alkalimarinus coralli]|uniref:hypothetical protein n=1 Tax=Alkalimarinus coralli TaxID=2935863 RepID=UPI00202AFD69|nr:hypothetical protein [Alkalimarinus coralli]
MQGGTTGIRVELPLLPKSSVETNGESSWRIVDALVDNLPGMMAANNASNTRVRFQDDWGDEDKFTEPMKRYPAASLELLLNGLYPLNAEFELMPVEKKLVGRNRGRAGIDLYEMKGNRAKVTVDLPYFIEGESELIIELRIRQDDKDGKEKYSSLKFGEKLFYTISHISKLKQYKSGSTKGEYINRYKGKDQLIVLHDFSKDSFSNPENLPLDEELLLECRIKLHVTPNTEEPKKGVQMPWRGDALWVKSVVSTIDKDMSWITLDSRTPLRS